MKTTPTPIETFVKLLEVTKFHPAYAARKILYEPNSVPAQRAAELGFVPDDDQKKLMRYVCANNLDALPPQDAEKIRSLYKQKAKREKSPINITLVFVGIKPQEFGEEFLNALKACA
ncbi:hypothetical protein [Thiolinea disciformis]|uniref:hypothetical protein n=1 Tax=Thiolinea disciformis TaxID=125614 RepID=UPI00038147DA|nr:hypothetical protein [Thiolinea disciformis]